jgi:hypothetical protein
MKNERFWKSVFLTKSSITCAEGAALFFADSWLRQFLHNQPLINVEYSQLFFGLVFLIGVAYWWISNDISKNHGIIKFGIGAQFLVFVLLAYHTLIGNVHPLYLIPGVIDLVFAILYSVFLFLYSIHQIEPSLTTSLDT